MVVAPPVARGWPGDLVAPANDFSVSHLFAELYPTKPGSGHHRTLPATVAALCDGRVTKASSIKSPGLHQLLSLLISRGGLAAKAQLA